MFQTQFVACLFQPTIFIFNFVVCHVKGKKTFLVHINMHRQNISETFLFL